MRKFLRPAVHIGALIPLAWLIWDAFNHHLSANPIQAATFRTGKTALTLLMLSLACTPLASVFGFKEALKVRRALGLYAYLYVSIHFLIFVGLDYTFNLKLIGQAIIEKRFVLAGMAAGLVLLPLAITSFGKWMKRLGKNWKRLHRLVYLAGLLAVIHYTWLVKSDIRVPLVYAGILLVLLILRITPVKRTAYSLRMRLAASLNRLRLSRHRTAAGADQAAEASQGSVSMSDLAPKE